MILPTTLRIKNMASHRGQVGRGMQLTEETVTLQFGLDKDVLITVNPNVHGGHSAQLCVKGKWCGKPVQHLLGLQNLRKSN